jgi:PAS domain S-box-containing protein
VSERGVLLYVNRRLSNLVGRDRRDLIGTDATALVDPADRSQLINLLDAPAGQTNRAELNLAGHDGTTVPALTSATGLDIDGVLVRCLVAADLTSRRRQGREIADANAVIAAHSADLERANTELGRSNEDLAQFAYAASHDLAEPLRTITAFADLLRQRYRGRLDADADDFIEFITSSATRMQQLIADMLAYSRVDTLAKPFTAVDAQQVFETVLADLNSRINETGAIVRSRTLPVLNADRTQLAQVLANLIRNALTFVGADVTPRVLVWAEPDGGAWRFTVADNGIGIPPEHRQRVFGMFKRLHTRDVYSGTGVGLAIVQKVVQRHGGIIWIEDNPGGGCRLIFTIPRADSAPDGPTLITPGSNTEPLAPR